MRISDDQVVPFLLVFVKSHNCRSIRAYVFLNAKNIYQQRKKACFTRYTRIYFAYISRLIYLFLLSVPLNNFTLFCGRKLQNFRFASVSLNNLKKKRERQQSQFHILNF